MYVFEEERRCERVKERELVNACLIKKSKRDRECRRGETGVGK